LAVRITELFLGENENLERGKKRTPEETSGLAKERKEALNEEA